VTRRPEPSADRLVVAGWGALVIGTGLLAGLLGGALAGADVAIQVGISLTRSGMDAAAVACVGLTLLGVLLPLGAATLPGNALRTTTEVQSAADRVTVAAAGLWLALVLVGIALRTADALARPLSQLTADDVGAWATRLAAGRGLLLTAGCAAVVLGCAIARLRRAEAVQIRIPLVAAVLGTLMAPLTGHTSSAADHQLAVVSAALHAGSAALWVGGLATLLVLVARHRDLLDATLPRFSTLAACCVLAVAATGVINASTRLESWVALVDTGYGRLVLAKTTLLVALAGLGWLARRRMLARHTPVLRWASLEVALMAVTIGVAAALSQTGSAGHEIGGAHAAAGTAEHADHEPAAPAGGLDLWAVQSATLGAVVVDPSYRIVYRSDRDSAQPPTSTCIDPSCTGTWAPLLTGDQPVVGRGVDQAAIGTLTRPDGTEQVTLGGWPLYVRVGEANALATGGANGTDGVWFAVSPTGTKAAPPPGG
jgi:putative copper resistance protein D